MTDNTSNSLLSIEDFTELPKVKECKAQLENTFGDGKAPFIISDVLDEQGHQYVNLVQKGGGVLGMALVGYTYILEEMGIRFLKLAGTSAGAINTSLMTVIGQKEDAKSQKILRYICDLDFFKLVDGHPAAKWVIKRFITHKDYSKKLKKGISLSLALLPLLLLLDFFFLGLQNKYNVALVTACLFVLTGLYILVITVLFAYITTLMKRLKNSGFGINPGDYFYDWIKARLKENGVETVSELNNKAEQEISGLKLRHPNDEGLSGLTGSVTFIASELVTQNKIKFPEMCKLFRLPQDIDTLKAAGFVRASMAIPVFFESYFIENIPCDDTSIQELWKKELNVKEPPSTARFVDGGILSNFPIDIFYNSKVTVPRLPVFGIDLDDSKPADKTMHASSWSFGGYFGRIFNTIRFFADKDFLQKNRMFERGIGSIKLADYNWLNFFLTPEEKKDMFAKGAEAATQFLLKFDWEAYKKDRESVQKEMTGKS